MNAADNPPPPAQRRKFFREALRTLLDTAEDIHGALRRQPRQPSPRPALERAIRRQIFLRPPGALPEAQFVDTCQHTAQCVASCPVQAIELLRPGVMGVGGTPHIVPQLRACVVCDDLACMHACPSGALLVVAREDIAMGMADVDMTRCVRSQDEECVECIDRCPFGSAALTLGSGGEVVVGSACTGCGVCEHFCPTEPRAIQVRPGCP